LYNFLQNSLLNLTCTKLGSFDVRGNNFVVTFIVWRALGGRKARKIRAVFDFAAKGLKTVLTSVKNLVIMTARVWRDL
jgi:hypothetical protein